MALPSGFRVLVAGGGVAALEAVLALRDLGGDALDLTIVAPDDRFRFRPLAVGELFAAGHVGTLALESFAGDTGARLHMAAARAVDARAQVLKLTTGEHIPFDALLLAVGARAVPAVAHAVTWCDENDIELLGGVLRDLEMGYSRRVAFVVPPGCGWPLPLYEVALMTARDVRGSGVDDLDLTIVTDEAAPLSLFGPRASSVVGAELHAVGITVRTGVYVDPENSTAGRLALRPGDATVAVDRLVALPRLEGRRIEGVPATRSGFTPVDRHGRVVGLEGVWAAGDATAFPIKQGGVAAQQAEAAAASIAAAAGLDVEPTPFEPVLRGTLLTGERPWHLRLARGSGDGRASRRPLWWPSTKIAGRRLSPYLAARLEAPAGLSVEVRVEGAASGQPDGMLVDLNPSPGPRRPQ
jgi:sulfide:quinone oxidoreductase